VLGKLALAALSVSNTTFNLSAEGGDKTLILTLLALEKTVVLFC
jgi:hypothetical protein